MSAPLRRRLSCASAPASSRPRRAPPRETWASPSPTSRGPVPGDHRPVENQQHRQPPGRGTRNRDPRPFCFSELVFGPTPHPPNAIRSEEGGENMTISELVRTDGTVSDEAFSLGQLHDRATNIDE